MAIVFRRIYAYCKNNHQPHLKVPDRQEIGRLINEAYRKEEKWQWIIKERKKEPQGMVNVWVYPSWFIPKMDAIISKWFEDNKNIPKSTPKRRRIIKPTYSASPVKNQS